MKTAIEQFLGTGGPVAPGAKTIGRWHAPGSVIGWHLIEGDLAAVSQHVAEWAELLEYDIYPVMDDAEAAAVAKKMFGASDKK
jgi:hypothetical protein